MIRSRLLVSAAVAVTSTACVSAHGSSAPYTGTRLVLAGEPMFAMMPDGTVEVVREAATPSLALDRITKRQPLLNGTVRRASTGRGVTIYVFDGGIADDHPELAGRVRIGFDAFPSRPRVCNAHGTAVAGAAAGTTLGVAPDAKVVDVKIINCERQHGSIDAIVEAARWTVADHALHPGPAVANWSFVVDTTRTHVAIDSAVAMLRDAGILVVTSAGNFETDACHVTPANAPGALVVGASALVRDARGAPLRDVRASGTAFGACIDVYAPGDSVLLPTTDPAHPATIWNGTSMAAGYVSGAASLLLEHSPATTPDELSELLVQHSTPAIVDERRPALSTTPVRGRLLYIGPS